MFNSKIPSLETYMAQIAHELRDLPSQARADEMREIETHLAAMIEARGDVAAVLAQFGKPRKVGRDLRRAWERKQPESWWKMGLSMLSVFAVMLIYSLVMRQFIIAEAESNPAVTVLESHLHLNLGADSLIFRNFPLFLMTAGIFATFAKGYVAGLISPKRGALIALSFISLQLILRIALTPNYFASYLSVLSSFTELIQNVLIVLVSARIGARHSWKRKTRFAR